MAIKQHYQVIIVGGGPVGAAMAVALGLRGISCALIERHLQPQHIPKGQNLSQHSMENLFFWEVAADVRAARVLPPNFPIGGITAYRDLSSDQWFAPFGRETVAQIYFQKNERLPQYLTEEVLRRKLTTLPSVTTMFGWTAESVEQDSSGVRIVVSKEGDPQATLHADYVVGCDGAHSLVREQLGIKCSGPMNSVGTCEDFHIGRPTACYIRILREFGSFTAGSTRKLTGSSTPPLPTIQRLITSIFMD